MNLPHHRRHQWPIGRWRYNKWRIVVLSALAMVAAIVWLRHEYLVEHNLRLKRENEVRDLLAAHLKPRFGAPGAVKTDWVEGTERMDK